VVAEKMGVEVHLLPDLAVVAVREILIQLRES
jgi:predicted RecB family endonuclease